MTSLCFNIGPGNLETSSAARYYNEQNFPQAAESFLLWNKAGGQEMAGLTNRRAAEKELYETTDEYSA